MKLPTYEQQITQPQKEITQPVEQAFGIETAQAKQQLASGIQQATEQIGNRLIQMEENNQAMTANEQLLKFQATDMEKRKELLSRDEKNAIGATLDYAKWYEQESKKTLDNVPERLRRSVEATLTDHHTQGQNQVSTHEISQQKSYLNKLDETNVGLQSENVKMNNSDAGLFLARKEVKKLLDGQAARNGEPQELSDLKLKLWDEKTITDSVNSLILSGDLVSAKARLENNPEMLGGKQSQEYKEKLTHVENLIDDSEMSDTADKYVDENFKGQTLEKGIESISKLDKSAKYKESLTSRYRERWNIRAQDKRIHYAKVTRPVYEKISAGYSNLLSNSGMSIQAYQKNMTKEINSLDVDDATKMDMGTKVNDIIRHVTETRQREYDRSIARANVAATREQTAEARARRIKEQADDDRYVADYNYMTDNPNAITSVYDLDQRRQGKNRLSPANRERLINQFNLNDPKKFNIGNAPDKKTIRSLNNGAKTYQKSGAVESKADYYSLVHKVANSKALASMNKNQTNQITFGERVQYWGQAISEVNASLGNQKNKQIPTVEMEGKKYTRSNGELYEVTE